MTTKTYCMNHDSIAYASCLDGVEIKGIEYGIDDTVYAVAGAWCSKKSYHHVKINYSGERPYFRVNGCRVYLDECIRMGV